ncbi:MAG: hypothetical protein LBL35_07765 [Clostridiales bacterium]|nr:hypothetical protein [Clostridiales bacterium]
MSRSVVFALITAACLSAAAKRAFYKKPALYKMMMAPAISGDYEVYRTRSVKYYFSPQAKRFLPMVRRTFEWYLTAMERDFGVEAAPTVVMHNDEETMKNAINVKDGRAPLGAYYLGVIHILSPGAWTDDDAQAVERFLSEGPVVHEMAHYMLDLKTGGNYETWFSEGVALYFEYKYMGAQWRPDLEEESRRVTLDDLSKRFEKIDKRLAYRRSFDIIKDIVSEKGESAIFDI